MASRQGVVLFGGLALFGFAWQPLTDRRDAAVDPKRWQEIRQTTSFWPFAAWHARSDPVTLRPLIIGAVVYVILVLVHPWLFGMPVIRLTGIGSSPSARHLIPRSLIVGASGHPARA